MKVHKGRQRAERSTSRHGYDGPNIWFPLCTFVSFVVKGSRLKKQAAPGDGAAWLAKSSGEEGELVYSDGPVG